MQAQFGLDFPLHLGNAERTPFPDASFDLAISEYGASIWCDPYKVDPGGGTPAAIRRTTHLPDQRRDPDDLHARRCRRRHPG